MWIIVVDLKAAFPCWVAIDTLTFPTGFSVYPTSSKQCPTIVFGSDYSSLKNHIDTYIGKTPIALAVEAPMYWLFERKQRFPNESQAWYKAIAAQATGLAYFHAYEILKHIVSMHRNIKFTYDIDLISPSNILLFEAFATGSFKVDMGSNNKRSAGQCYSNIASFLPFGANSHFEDWIDAYLCGLAFNAYYNALVNRSTKLLNLINNTSTQRKLNKNQKQYNLQALRVDCHGNQYLGATNSTPTSMTKPIYNQWSAILNTIYSDNKLLTDSRCEIFGIKFK